MSWHLDVCSLTRIQGVGEGTGASHRAGGWIPDGEVRRRGKTPGGGGSTLTIGGLIPTRKGGGARFGPLTRFA